VDVPIDEFRDRLSELVDRARAGAEIIALDDGLPVARLIGLAAATPLQRLAADEANSQDTPPQRPTATGRARPRARRPLSDIVSSQRE
jgi:prevent-host-death family protein